MRRTNLYGFEEPPSEPYSITIIKIVLSSLILILGVVSIGVGLSLSAGSKISGLANFNEIKPFYEILRSISLIGGVPPAVVAVGGIAVVVLKNKIGFIIYMVLSIFLFADSGMCGLATFAFHYLLDSACFQLTDYCWKCDTQPPSNVTDTVTWRNQYCTNEAWINGTVRCFHDPEHVQSVCEDNNFKLLLVSSSLFGASVVSFALMVLSLSVTIAMWKSAPKHEEPENLVKTTNLTRNQFQFYNDSVNKQHQIEMDEAKRLESHRREAPPPKTPSNNNFMTPATREKVVASPSPAQKARKGLPPLHRSDPPHSDSQSFIKSAFDDDDEMSGPYRG